MVVDLILAGAIFALAGVLMLTRGNFNITIIHKRAPEDIKQELVSLKSEMEKEMTNEEQKFYKESGSVIAELNKLIYGELEDTGDGKENQ